MIEKNTKSGAFKTQNFIWFLIFIACLLRFLNCFQNNPLDNLWSDPGRHWNHAIDPMSYNPMGAFDPIMYQVWLGAVAKITHGQGVPIAIYAGILSVLTPFAWYLFFKKLFKDSPNYALAGLLILAWLPSWVPIYSYFMNETLLLPILGLALFFTWEHFDREDLRSFVKMVVMWLVACLTKAIALPAALICVIYSLVKYSQAINKKILALVLFCVCSLVPLIGRTQAILKVWAPFGFSLPHQIYMRSNAAMITYEIKTPDGGTYVWSMANPSINRQLLPPFSKWKSNRTTNLKVTIDSNYGMRDWKLIKKQFTPKLTELFNLYKANLIFFFYGQPWPENDPKSLWSILSVYSNILWLPLLLFSVFGNLFYLKKYKKLSLLPIINMLSWILCIASVDVGEPRYHKPLEGLLITNILWLVWQWNLSKNKNDQSIPTIKQMEYSGI